MKTFSLNPANQPTFSKFPAVRQTPRRNSAQPQNGRNTASGEASPKVIFPERHADVPDDLIAENERRNKALETDYDPVPGRGSSGRRRPALWEGRPAMLPESLLADPEYTAARTPDERAIVRFRHDFEFWALSCVIINDKESGRDIPFRLNAPQRRVLAILEAERTAGRPIRIILLKARQWGGSTLIQIYMAWIQICLRRNWNSLICAHVKDTSATIRGMYGKLLDNYPQQYWVEEGAPSFKPFERSVNIRQIEGRGCRVVLGSAENQDGARGTDFAMAHLSEVAFWKETPGNTPEMLVRAVCGAINCIPLTLIAMESTANGVGNYFHREWLRAKARESDKLPVFVPWHEIEIYRTPVADPAAVWNAMDSYERDLWKRGLTLEMIAWFHRKRREYASLREMLCEYPSSDIEAFANTGYGVFNPDDIEAMRKDCAPGTLGEITGDDEVGPDALSNVVFTPCPDGRLEVWKMPEPEPDVYQSDRYVVAVDVGGRSPGSDWSVIIILDTRGGPGGDRPEMVAQWRGHIDHDILAWKACAIATFWNSACVVFESNTLETEATDGDPTLFILNEIKDHYFNLYRRPASDSATGTRIGFHTNRATKTMIINRLISLVRRRMLVEHSSAALDELLSYRLQPNGSYGAADGSHDDMLMARAIALHAVYSQPRLTDSQLREIGEYVRRQYPRTPGSGP